MSELRLDSPAMILAGQARIVRDDIIYIRTQLFPDGLTSPSDAAQLLAIHKSCSQKCVEWDDWFVEVMTAYIVFHCWPQHSLDELNAGWMIGMFSRDGVIETPAELELILHAIEVARSVPDELSALAIGQIRQAIAFGAGAHAMRRGGDRRAIGQRDMDYLYRILRGSACGGKMWLSAREIEEIEALGRLTLGRENHAAWNDLLDAIEMRDADGHADARPWLHLFESGLPDFGRAA